LFQDNSDGDTSTVKVYGNGSLDLSGHGFSVDIGSLEGDGNVFSSDNGELVVGGNNRSTEFSGVISGLGGGGELTKEGTGTLTLSGVNTYGGDTFVDEGVLKVNGSIESETTVLGGKLAGTETVEVHMQQAAKVSNQGGTVSPGDPVGTLTVAGDFEQAQGTLLINIEGAGAGQFGVLNVFGTAELDEGDLQISLLNGFIPTAGDTFAFLLYGDHFGELTLVNPNFDNLHWDVSYEDTMAILTVKGGSVLFPDQGSTLLLLTLGLLGLMTHWRQLLRKQA
jgi:autotransporter-associated beta strand protein